MENETMKKRGGSVVQYFIAAFVLVIIIIGVLGVVLINRAADNGSTNPIVVGVSSALNTPVVTVNGTDISYAEYARDVDTVQRLAATDQSVTYTKEQISDEALRRLIEDVFVRDLADEFDLTVSDEELEELFTSIFAQAGGEEAFGTTLEETIGMSVDEYKKRLRPFFYHELLREKTASSFATSTNEAYQAFSVNQRNVSHILVRVTPEIAEEDARSTAEAALARIQNGEEFAVVAGEVSDDTISAVDGGTIGWVTQGDGVPALDDAVFSNDIGLIPSITTSSFGFHVLQTTGERKVNSVEAYIADAVATADITYHKNIHELAL